MKQSPAARALTWSIVAATGLTALIALLGPLLAEVPHLADKGSAWYFWQLPDRTTMGRLTAWLGYGLHQATIWILLFLLMKDKRPEAGKVSRLNLWLLLANGAFVLLHILQTHLWYDGLAQDVPVWSSQFSVIIMLVMILYQMAPRRGLFLGRTIAWKPEALGLSYRIHGFYISWALVYTFWFHPTEGQFGLLIGFFYMFLLLTQLSLARTTAHLSAAWVAVLELLVGLHGPLIAIQKALMDQEGGSGLAFAGPGGIWVMFTAGFLFLFAFSGQYSFRLPRWAHNGIIAAYLALVAFLYSQRGFGHLYEVAFIPAALYGGALAWAVLMRLAAFRKKSAAPGPQGI